MQCLQAQPNPGTMQAQALKLRLTGLIQYCGFCYKNYATTSSFSCRWIEQVEYEIRWGLYFTAWDSSSSWKDLREFMRSCCFLSSFWQALSTYSQKGRLVQVYWSLSLVKLTNMPDPEHEGSNMTSFTLGYSVGWVYRKFRLKHWTLAAPYLVIFLHKLPYLLQSFQKAYTTPLSPKYSLNCKVLLPGAEHASMMLNFLFLLLSLLRSSPSKSTKGGRLLLKL